MHEDEVTGPWPVNADDRRAKTPERSKRGIVAVVVASLGVLTSFVFSWLTMRNLSGRDADFWGIVGFAIPAVVWVPASLITLLVTRHASAKTKPWWYVALGLTASFGMLALLLGLIAAAIIAFFWFIATHWRQ